MARATGRMVMSLLMLGTLVPAARGADESLMGSRVRVRASERREAQVGVLEHATPDALVIRRDGAASPVSVRRRDVLQLEVSRGTRRHTLQGLLGGAIAWAAIFGVLAATDSLPESGVNEPLFVGGMLALGAGVGSLVKTERWERVPAGGVPVGGDPRPRGLRAQVTVRF